ncbi:MAG: hypothetical protein JOZ89_07175 [Gammaproteobacteria bacterium]|nr:hypothetical protein [Gammaproteobacteria bacterium]
MKLTAWAFFGSLLVAVLVAPVVAGGLGAPVRAVEPHVRSLPHSLAPVHPGRTAAPAARRPGYLVEARMGWAVS